MTENERDKYEWQYARTMIIAISLAGLATIIIVGLVVVTLMALIYN